MQIIKLNPISPNERILQQAADLIESGAVIICPTDTVYILAVNALDRHAVAKVFAIKGRSDRKPIHVNVRDFNMASKLVKFNQSGEKLFKKMLPGPLTIVLPKKSIVPSSLTGDLPTLGIRIPDNVVIQGISQICAVPYTTTSANPAGGQNPYSTEDILSQFSKETIERVDLILDCGQLPHTPPSTVVDVTTDQPKILRQGPITEEQIREVLRS